MPYTSYAVLNNLKETTFISGTLYEYNFEYFTDDSFLNPSDLTGFTGIWRLCLYGQPEYCVLQKNMNLVLPNIFNLRLLSSDTRNIRGDKYMQQPIIHSTITGEDYILGQGSIIIQSQIKGV